MFVVSIIIFISVTLFVLLLHVCRLLCRSREAPPPHGDPHGPAPPPLHPMPALPSLPGGGGMFGMEPPPYSEVAAKPALFPYPEGPFPYPEGPFPYPGGPFPYPEGPFPQRVHIAPAPSAPDGMTRF